MALVLNDTTYAGEAASGFVVKALTGADTVKGGHIYMKDNVVKKFTIPSLKVSNLIQDRTATPTSQGTMTVDGRALTPADFMLYHEFNPRDFEDHWIAAQMNDGLIDRRLPVSAESQIIQEHLKFVASFFDTIIWQGDTALSSNLKYFDGLIKKLTASSDTIDVTSPFTISEDNVIDALEDCHQLIPKALLFDPGMKYHVSYATAEFYRRAQQDQTYKGVDITSGGVMTYNGKRIVPLAGCPDNTIVLAKSGPSMDSQLWMGLDSTMTSEGEASSIKFSPLQANSELWFIKMLFKMDVQIGLPEEVVMFKL